MGISFEFQFLSCFSTACKHQVSVLKEEKRKRCELQAALGKSRGEESDPVRTEHGASVPGRAVLQGPGSSAGRGQDRGQVPRCGSGRGKGLCAAERLVRSHLLLCLAAASKSCICSVLQSTLCHGFGCARTGCPSRKHREWFLERLGESGGGRSKDAPPVGDGGTGLYVNQSVVAEKWRHLWLSNPVPGAAATQISSIFNTVKLTLPYLLHRVVIRDEVEVKSCVCSTELVEDQHQGMHRE